MLRCFWLNIFLFLLSYSILAQTVIEPEWLTIEDGLSQGFVRDIMKDRDGFLWIATKNGLNRYDGKHFKVFTHDPADPYSISDDYVLTLHDFEEFILVGTKHPDLNLFHKRTSRFYKIPMTVKRQANWEWKFEYLGRDSLGQFWVQIDEILTRLRFPDDFQSQFPQQEELLNRIEVLQFPEGKKIGGNTNTLLIDTLVALNPGSSKFWVNLDSRRLWKLDYRKGEAYEFEDFPLPSSNIGKVECLSNGKLVLLEKEDGLYILSEGNWKKIKTDFEVINFHTFIQEQQVWISTNQGVLIFEEKDLEKKNLTQRDARFKIPGEGLIIQSLDTDKSGNSWAGTYGYGCVKISPRQFKIKSKWLGSSIGYPPFLSINGDLYIANSGTDGELILLNQESTLLDTLFHIHRVTLKKDSIKDIDRFEILMGLHSAVTYDPDTRSFFLVNTGGAYLSSLFQYNVDQDQLIEHDISKFFNSQPVTYCIAKTTSGQIWVGTDNGLVHVTLNEGKVDIEHLIEELNGLRSNEVASLLKDPVDDHILWIGTKGGGLHRLDTRDMSWTYINSKNGLPNDVIYGVLNDDHGNLWMSSNKGIIQYNPATGDIINFTKADGLQSDEFNTYAYAKAPGGQMLFGGINGLNIFHPDDLQDNPVTPKVRLTELRVNSEAVTVGDSTGLLSETITYTSELTLPFSLNSLTLQFAALEFTAPSKNRFRYYLEGAEKEWSHESTENRANYLNLSPGTYTFKVKGANSDGIWSDEITSLKINIQPPWYRTTLAYFIYLALFGLGIWRILKFREARIRLTYNIKMERQKAERMQEIDKMKSRFFTNISHEFRTPLTVISGMADNLVENPERWLNKGSKMIKRSSDNLLNLVNQILDLRKLESGYLELNLIQSDLVAYLKYIFESFHSYAESKDINLHFESEQPEVIMDFDPEKILSIVSNLLSNAIKFTPEGGDIFIKIKAENINSSSLTHDASLLIQVKDTGIGIPEDKLPHIFDRFFQVDDSSTRKGEGTGIGLALTYELVKLMKGDIEVNSPQGKGTEFKVKIPITREAPLTEAKDDLLDHKDFDQPVTMINIEELETKPVSVHNATLPPLLIVEDNPNVREYLITCLEDQFQLEIAHDGQEGIEKAIEQIPDIIISDVMMPRKDGFELCHTLKTDERTSHIPIVLLTAKADQDSRISGLERGADDYLTKPFNKKELFVRLNNLLKIRQRLQERYSSLEVLEPTQEIALQQEDEFITKVRDAIEENLDDETFGIAELCKAVAISRAQLHRKMKALTNRSTSQYIRSIKLVKAKQLLETTDLNISQVAFEVGFNDPKYFSRTFSEEFGFSPTSMRK